MTDQERIIFANAHEDYEAAFGKLFALYANDLYRATLGATFYNEAAAQQLMVDIFTAAYKYLHTFSPQQGSFRLYLFSQVIQHLQQRENRIPPLQDTMPKKLKHHLSHDAQKVWYAIQQLPTREWLVFELWHGANLSTSELSIVLQTSLVDVQQLQATASQRLRKVTPIFLEQVHNIYQQRNTYATLSPSQQLRLMRLILDRKRLRMTFVRYSFLQRLLQPSSLLALITVLVVSTGMVLAVMYREPLKAKLVQQETNPTTVSSLITEVTKRRPSFLFQQGELPAVEVVRQSLTETDETLFGTSYVTDTPAQTDTDTIQPSFAVNIKAEDFIPVESAYSYTVPEALTEDQLQYAALRHFVSLPLNQFTYVNGTYYVEEDPTEFRPLFIAFNNTGSVDFQMRQTAICKLTNLTEPIADTQAQDYGFQFLSSHRFVEVTQSDMQITQVSSPERTVAKDAFCQDGDQTPVQDRLIVYYAPHTSLRYGEAAGDELPLRLPGIAVQLHGSEVTNMRVDNLFLLLQQATRSEVLTLKSVTQAMIELQAFQYPGDNTTVFPQTIHTHGSDRLTSMTIDDVQLEYVYDELNHRIEPYYVFSGLGTDGNNKVNEARWYVVASSTGTQLRGPYRE